ncbi:DNA methyltransferase [Sulfurimonas crateris]|uniref:site-specific DNA-methyltransferase (adenine-specific) n=1 Tax=Sulfurimonas crateris TaxID=2574727 RepID=A0A4U2Z6Y4_9BACT|nr:type ISP restriction/modification enzyme [Sulfurimonas crateris]TKI69969.1 DNA methyltransferase [Sulfurimonas crateris]
MQKLHDYITKISNEFLTGSATEHTYRGHLKDLVEAIDANVIAINEPKRVKAGAPDYLIATKSDNIEIGHIEAKDIGKDLNHKDYNEQFTRYKNALENLIITDYMEFQFYKNAQLYTTIKIAEILGGKIVSLPQNFAEFINLIKDFTSFVGQSITSSSRLACMMAHKAKLMADVMLKAIEIDIEADENTELYSQYKIFKQMLIHDMTPKDFADMYAQTITYGMFTARFHDSTLQTFSRQEAAELLPHSNPFLRKLFQQLAGYDLDIRISWIVDSLVKIFLATDVTKLLENFGSTTQRNDPIIHFYEEFLAEFDPKLRKSRGVWYTPEPVVKFIVRAVDEVLTSEFNLPKGLSDTSKITIKVDNPSKKGKIDKEVHKVQVLDPATGTGTFLAETIKFLYEKKQYLKWNSYVTEHLIPRLHGFEIVMASYAMAHLKLDLLLKLTGYEPTTTQRLKVFLTNSLEEHHDETGNLFASFLATESQEADRVKKETPVMVVMGNPPYAVSSSNKGEWISKLLQDYKKNLNERKISLDDDYIKFIRYGQHYVENNGEGILAYISNNSFIDGITHRQMRKSLLECFDKIYILDLHGNAKKKEVCPDGSKDENVFDIMQGVSINIFIKTTKSKKLADVYHYDLYGKREFKYDFLNDNSLKNIAWKKLECNEPYYFFITHANKNEEYKEFVSLQNLLKVYSTGVQTSRDYLAHSFTKEEQVKKNDEFQDPKISDEEIRQKYFTETSRNFQIGDTRDWKLSENRKKAFKSDLNSQIIDYCFRPFDNRYLTYSDILTSWTRKEVGKHLLNNNYSLIFARSSSDDTFNQIFYSKYISDVKCGERTKGSIFSPLYLYPDENSLTTERTPNLNLEIVKEIEEKLGLAFVNEKTDVKDSFAPIDILDYIYAVLHSPAYREKYKEFLKIDFPRVPYPQADTFWELVKLGGELRSYHLLENPKVYEIVIALNESENNTIERKISKKDVEIEGDFVKLWLNDEQYIDKIPLIAWEFYIGGYQPAQKWLKDRAGREMREEDYEHYNKIIVALTKTHEIMQKIDTIFEI